MSTWRRSQLRDILLLLILIISYCATNFQGMVRVFAHESTASVCTNAGEDKPDARIKRHIMGREMVVGATEEQLDFGVSEQIVHGEFDQAC